MNLELGLVEGMNRDNLSKFGTGRKTIFPLLLILLGVSSRLASRLYECSGVKELS